MADADQQKPPTTLSPNGTGNERFDAEAAEWDANAFVHEMSAEAAKALQRHVPALQQGTSALDVLEIGCGTGLLTLLLAPCVRGIVAVDASQGMIDVLAAKLAGPAAEVGGNVVPLALMLEDPEDVCLPPARDGDAGKRKFDLVVSHLVLHHVPDLRALLHTMLGCLKPGGRIALTDFEDFGPEARRFHPEAKMEGVARHGVHAGEFCALAREVGFEDVDAVVAWDHSKKVEKWPGEFGDAKAPAEELGEMMRFTYLLCTGRKPLGESSR